MNEDMIAFFALSREEQLEMVTHVLNSGSLQEYTGDMWVDVDYLPEYEDGIYRISQK